MDNDAPFSRPDREMMAQIVTGSPIPMFVIDKDHRVTHFNKACEILTGIDASDIVGTRDQWRAFYSHPRPVMADMVLDADLEKGLERHYRGKYRMSAVKPGAVEAEDFFPDLGEDGKWLFFTAAPLMGADGEIIGAMETLQDVTFEKREAELNSAMLRISKALQNYAYLEDLLNYISQEIKTLLSSEGALVVMYDDEADELYIPGMAYDDPSREKRLKDTRFSLDEVAAGEVIRKGLPVILNESSTGTLYPERDRKMGYVTRNLVEVPVFADDRDIGVLCAINKKEGVFGRRDADRLSSLAGTVALAIENVRFQEDLRIAYREVRALNTAKDKAINHLSHELKTPLTVLSEAVKLLEDELAVLPEEDVKPLTAMIRRHLHRLMDIKEEVADIIGGKDERTQGMMLLLLDQCVDLLSVLSAKETGSTDVIGRLRRHIEGIFKPLALKAQDISLPSFVSMRIDELRDGFRHRSVRIRTVYHETRPVHIPPEILAKILDGLIRNAIENTPDGGLVEISVSERGTDALVVVRDHGIGIPEELCPRIFEGFYPTQSQTGYSTRKPYDFNAGGKGADLLRMKIFSQTYGFSIAMTSRPCPYCHGGKGVCPGSVVLCGSLREGESCDDTGGTEFKLRFH
jgi:signal transduction histidine kinase